MTKKKDLEEAKKRRRLIRTIRKKFNIKEGTERHEYIKNIVDRYIGLIDFGEIYWKMIDWCEEKGKPKSLRRYDNWLRKGVQFQEERKQRSQTNEEDNIDQIDEEERKRTREILNRYGRHKRAAGSS